MKTKEGGQGTARIDEGLSLLGGETCYRADYAPEVLESFANKHPGQRLLGTFPLS